MVPLRPRSHDSVQALLVEQALQQLRPHLRPPRTQTGSTGDDRPFLVPMLLLPRRFLPRSRPCLHSLYRCTAPVFPFLLYYCHAHTSARQRYPPLSPSCLSIVFSYHTCSSLTLISRLIAFCPGSPVFVAFTSYSTHPSEVLPCNTVCNHNHSNTTLYHNAVNYCMTTSTPCL